MTFTDAAAEVLRLVGKPLHYKEITDIAIEKNLLSHVGKSPEVTMGARLAAMLKKDTPENPLVRVKPGVFALREWDEKTIKSALEPKKGSKKAKVEAQEDAPAGEEAADDDLEEEEEIDTVAEVAALEEVVEASREREQPTRAGGRRGDRSRRQNDDEAPTVAPVTAGPDEAMRAEAAAGAGDIFDEEDDDDQPILGGPERNNEPEGDSRRGRRRRRRRGGRSTTEGAPQGGGGGALPTFTASPAFETRRDPSRDRDRDRGDRDSAPRGPDSGEGAARGPQVIEFGSGDGPALDDLAGRELGDAVTAILNTFDRNGGPVSLRQIAETAQRRGRLQGDIQLAQSQVAAAVRADNARRTANGSRPRFRFAGGRVALTDWLLGGDLARLEAEALAAVERYRDAARRVLVRKLSELPAHAFVELCVLLFERMGVGPLRVVRRAGAPGNETHLAGCLRAAGEDVRVAVVIRRDGREIGRERVSDLRGSLHHYGPATIGWVVTGGQVLSGAREEAAVPGTPPIALFDGVAIARLCEDHDVAVVRARLPIAIPDVDLLEALRAS